MVWEALAIVICVWVILLTLALYYISHVGDGAWGHWSRRFSDHLSAERKAHTLMREMLSPEQFQQLTRHGYFEIASPAFAHRTYRIPGAGGLVRVYERGQPLMDLCLQPVETLPEGDVVVMHKLMIEANEQEYLAKANHFAPGIISLRAGYL